MASWARWCLRHVRILIPTITPRFHGARTPSGNTYAIADALSAAGGQRGTLGLAFAGLGACTVNVGSRRRKMALSGRVGGGRHGHLPSQRSRTKAGPGPTLPELATDRDRAPPLRILRTPCIIMCFPGHVQQAATPTWRTPTRVHDGERGADVHDHHRPAGLGVLGWVLAGVAFGEVCVRLKRLTKRFRGTKLKPGSWF